MNFLPWNVRGISNSDTQTALKNLYVSQTCSICMGHSVQGLVWLSSLPNVLNVDFFILAFCFLFGGFWSSPPSFVWDGGFSRCQHSWDVDVAS